MVNSTYIGDPPVFEQYPTFTYYPTTWGTVTHSVNTTEKCPHCGALYVKYGLKFCDQSACPECRDVALANMEAWEEDEVEEDEEEEYECECDDCLCESCEEFNYDESPMTEAEQAAVVWIDFHSGIIEFTAEDVVVSFDIAAIPGCSISSVRGEDLVECVQEFERCGAVIPRLCREDE